MKVLIVDDEAPARERLQQLLQKLDDIEVVGTAADGKSALSSCRKFSPDTVLMDIRMPGMDGLEAARHLATLEQPPAVIFTTAYGDHALEAFDSEAVDYLLKPIRRERLGQALSRAERLTRTQLSALSRVNERARSHLSINYQGNIHLIPVDEVIYFQADQKYVTVYHHDGEALLDESLKTLEQEFGERFIRIHRNALVAASALSGMERDNQGSYHICLNGSDEKPEISRRHVAAVRQLLKNKV